MICPNCSFRFHKKNLPEGLIPEIVRMKLDGISYRAMEIILRERGIEISSATLHRYVKEWEGAKV